MSIVLDSTKQAVISLTAAGLSLAGVDSSKSLLPFIFFTSYHLAKKISLHELCLLSGIPKQLCNFVFLTFVCGFMFNFWFFYSTAVSFNYSAAARSSLILTKFLTETTSNMIYSFNQQVVDIFNEGPISKVKLSLQLAEDLKLMYQNGLSEIVSYSLAASALVTGKFEDVKMLIKNVNEIAQYEIPVLSTTKGFLSSVVDSLKTITDKLYENKSEDKVDFVDNDLSKALTLYQNVDKIPPNIIQSFTINSVQTLLTSLDGTITGDMTKAIDIMNLEGSLENIIRSSEEEAKSIEKDDNMFVRFFKSAKYALDPELSPLILAAVPHMIESMFDQFQTAVATSPYQSFKRFVTSPEYEELKTSTVQSAETSVRRARTQILKSKVEAFKSIEFQQSYGTKGLQIAGLGALSKVVLPIATVSAQELNEPDVTIGITVANVITILFMFGWIALVCSMSRRKAGKKEIVLRSAREKEIADQDEKELREYKLERVERVESVEREDREDRRNILNVPLPETTKLLEIMQRQNDQLYGTSKPLLSEIYYSESD